jgi:ornithine carbamoyltransferase
MADLLTTIDRGLHLPGSKWAWLGDGNNVLHSIIEAASLLQFDVRIACPEGYDPDPAVLSDGQARLLGRSNATITLTRDPLVAVAGADVVVTDTWISMGQDQAEAKLAAMMPFQVTPGVMAAAAPDAVFLHCLPAHRGEEVVDTVIDGPQSAIWEEAENRLHAQKAVLLWCFGVIG